MERFLVDQYLIAMAAVVAFVGFAAVMIVLEIRRSNRVDREPTESGDWPL